MFERGKKAEDEMASQEAVQSEPEKAFGSFRPKSSEKSGNVAVIGSSIQINGDLRGNEDLRIEGNVSGTVQLKNNSLTIGKNGKVKAGVYAKSIAVDGETKGDLHATECVSIHANAKVQGNIIAPRVSIVEGAHFKGSIEMDPEAVDSALAKTPARGRRKTATTEKASTSVNDKTSSEDNVKTTTATPRAKSA